MTQTALFAPLVLLALLGCSRDAKLPPKVLETALARTTSLTEGQAAQLSGFQRSLYGSAKFERYYCVDFLAKKSLADQVIVTVYDDTTASFRPVTGGRILSGLVLAIDGEELRPQKTYVLLAVQQTPQAPVP